MWNSSFYFSSSEMELRYVDRFSAKISFAMNKAQLQKDSKSAALLKETPSANINKTYSAKLETPFLSAKINC